MPALFLQIVLFVLSFVLVWVGAGLAIDSIVILARRWKIPAFTLSFFLLGLLTSLPEMVIGTFSVIENKPGVFAGTLLGGIIVIMLCVIPLLAILGNGVASPNKISRRDLILILSVIVSPSLLIADQKITRAEGVLFLVLYCALFAVLAFEQSLFSQVAATMKSKMKVPALLPLHLLGGVLMLLFGGYQIVESTLFFADYFSVSAFFVSLIAVSLGTNVPEISLIIRSIRKGRKDVALADYLGSATANIPLMGALVLFHGETLILPNHFLQRIIFTALGLVCFFFFSGSEKKISRREGLFLFFFYLVFLMVEIFLAVES